VSALAALDAPRVLEAYAACEALTRRAAGNFYYGIRLLPPDKRRAMCAVYAFARRIDDIGDGEQPAARKRALLEEARGELAGANGDPVRLALADAEARFALPREALAELIDGVQMDVDGTRYESFEELALYCRRVAGTIGRLCVAIFGSSDPARADRLADDLGVAMQLTNILRDIREDAARGRTYLPRADLERFGCSDPLSAATADFAALVGFEAARAREWFERGLALLELIDARSGSCVAAMTGIYRRVLERIERDPVAVRAGRVSLPPWEKTWVALRSLMGAA
jgi:phytoene synthase